MVRDRETFGKNSWLAGPSVLIVMGLAVSILWMACFAVTDFNKEVDYFDGTTSVCTPQTEHEDCDIENCQRCNGETGLCEPDLSRNARDNDVDNAYVCDDGGTDCDDQNNQIHPGASERCNYLDDDCDGVIDEGMLAPAGSGPIELFPGANPVVDYDGQNISVAWEVEETSGTYQKRIKFAYLTIIGTTVFQVYLTEFFDNYNMESPSLAHKSGSDMFRDYGIAWIDLLGQTSVNFAVVQPNGTLPLTSSTYYTSIASTGLERMSTPVLALESDLSACAVAWVQQEGTDGTTAEIFLAFFGTADGKLIEGWGPKNISSSSGIESEHPSIVRVGDGFVVAWVEKADAVSSSIRLAYFSAESGEIIGQVSELPFDGSRKPSNPSLARPLNLTEPGVFMAFQALPEGDTREEIFGTHVDLASVERGEDAFSTPLQISHTASVSVTPSAFWSNDAIGIAWNERGTTRNIYFARISGSDHIPASDELDLGEGQNPALISPWADDRFAVVWHRPEDSNVYMRVVECGR